MKRLILFFFLMLQKFAFAQVAVPDTVVLRIDPEAAMGGLSAQFYSELTYVPLENSKKCVIGEVSKLEVVDKYYIVFDRGLDQIVLFNQDGSFHSKCANAPGLRKTSSMMNNFNFNVFGDFAVDRLNSEIIVKTNLDRDNLYVFDYEGVFKRKVSLDFGEAVKRFWGFACLGDGRCVYNVNASSLQQNAGAVENHVLHYTNNLSYDSKKELPYTPNLIAKGADVQTTFDGPFYQSGTVDRCFFTRSYDYNLYLIDGAGIKQVFKMLLPLEYCVPNDFLTNEEQYKTKRFEYLNNNRKQVFSVSNIYSTGDYLFFKLNNNVQGRKTTFLYNLRSGSLVNLERVSPDDSTFFLPVISNNSSIKACDGNYIYSSFSSLELFNAKQAIKGKGPRYSATLNKYFSTQTPKSNPVIVKMKLQPNL